MHCPPTNNEVYELLEKWFNETPIPHGQIIDNGKRWCDLCKKAQPVLTCDDESNKTWEHKMCQFCTSLWPEYVPEWNQSVIDEDDPFYETLYSHKFFEKIN